MAQSRIIYEDSDYLAIHLPGKSHFTLITFGGLTHRPNGLWFWGRDSAEKLGFDSIGILAKSAHWYPRSSIERLVPAISSYSQATRVGYGFSMGAFGALKHGQLLGLTHVLALSPVNYRLRRILWRGDFSCEENPDLIVSCKETAPINIQIVDPFFSEDLRHAELFASAGNIRTIRTPFVDHQTIDLMRGSANVERMIHFLLNNDLLAMSGFLNSNRKKAHDRASNLARASLARGNFSRANKLWQNALDKGVKREVIEEARISALVEYGRRHLASDFKTKIQETESFIEKISLEAPKSLRLQKELAHWCMIYSSAKAALGPLRRALEITPTDIDRWLALGRALHAAGETEEALETLHKAIGACGETTELSSFIKRLKRVAKE